MRITKAGFFLAAAALFAGSCAGVQRKPETSSKAQEGLPASYHEVEILDQDRVVVGFPVDVKAFCCSHKHGTSPAVLDARKALHATPEHAEIRREGMDETDAHYHVLLHHAKERVLGAARKVARRTGFDLVMLPDAVRLRPGVVGKHIPDITQEVIDAIER